MLKRVNDWLQNRKKIMEQQTQLIKGKKYYEMVKAGSLFIKFIAQDIQLMKKQNLNRAQRRRFEHDLHGKGALSRDMIDYYSAKSEQILMYINQELKKKPQVQVAPKPPEAKK